MADANGEQLATDLVGQKLQTAEVVYVYKIPPLKTAGGHRADDWNLATPLKTCSLLVEQHGDLLFLLFHFLQNEDDPNSKTLFAKSKIDLSTAKTTTAADNDKDVKKQLSLEYFVESVVDSSRYFVLRIVDEKSGREAHIGFGFRDREEATDFRESLNYYQKSLRRQEEAAEAMKHFSESEDSGVKLSLGDGERIHISLGGQSKGGSKSTISKTPDKNSDGDSAKKGKPMLLKKPPAAPQLNKDVSISFGDIDINANRPDKEDISTAAIGELSSADDVLDVLDDDDDEFGDFEG